MNVNLALEHLQQKQWAAEAADGMFWSGSVSFSEIQSATMSQEMSDHGCCTFPHKDGVGQSIIAWSFCWSLPTWPLSVQKAVFTTLFPQTLPVNQFMWGLSFSIHGRLKMSGWWTDSKRRKFTLSWRLSSNTRVTGDICVWPYTLIYHLGLI